MLLASSEAAIYRSIYLSFYLSIVLSIYRSIYLLLFYDISASSICGTSASLQCQSGIKQLYLRLDDMLNLKWIQMWLA